MAQITIPSPTSPPDVAGAVFDQKSQYDQIVPWLLGGEKLYAVYDCKGGGTPRDKVQLPSR